MKPLDKPTSNTISKKSTFNKNILTLAVIQALACSSTALYAANITVTSAADVVAVDGSCTLREAIASANNDADPGGDCGAGAGADTISFDNTLSGSTITLGGSELAIASDLTIYGDIDNDGAADITVDANGASRVLYIDTTGATRTVTLEGLTITGGSATEGGGVFCPYTTSKYCDVTISNSTITGNTATTGYGGGIRPIFGNISLSNTTVSGNTAASRDGGGIASYRGSLNLTNSTVSGNTAEGNGGGILTSYASVSLTNSTVSGNIANRGRGGGIASTGNSSPGAINLTNSTVTNNSASNGGGINSDYADITLTNSTVSDNSVANPYGGGRGGGINSSYGNLTLTNSTVSGNTTDAAGRAGGIYKQYDNLSLVNSTVSGNSSGTYGGGILVDYYGTLNLSNSTIVGNTAGNQGGGIYGNSYSYGGYTYGATFNLVNSILANNTGGDCYGSVNTNTASLITDNGVDCGITPALFADPMLGALANNGGPTQTHLPQAGSPVLDAGDNTNCGTGLTIATDQRGAPRDDGLCDIGAVEGTTSTLPIASVQFDTSTATVSEDGISITLNLTRSGDTVSAISVDYTTSDGTATAPADYTANMNTLNFATGVTSQSITIDITNDTNVESDENFSLALSNVQLVAGSAQVALGTNSGTTVTITDDDAAAGTGTAPASTGSSGSALSLSPWWMILLPGLTSWLRRKFKS